MKANNFSKEGLSVKLLISICLFWVTLLSATSNYSVYFGPSNFSPGITGTKTYKINFNSPTGQLPQISSLLSIKNGNGNTIVLENCKKLQIACLIRNLLKEAEIILLRPTSLTVSINNSIVFSKSDYDPKQGNFDKTFTAKKSNTMEIKIQGSIFSSVAISLKSAKVNLPPVANFTFNGTDFIAPTTVNFSGILSTDQDGGFITSYDWDFGDGGNGNGSLLSHTYLNPGNYRVVLTVTDNSGAQGSSVQMIAIKANQIPIAEFSLKLDTDLGEFNATVDGSKSTDIDGYIVEHIVDWGDGTSPEKTSVASNLSHIYKTAGIFTIGYWVKDNRGAVGFFEKIAKIEDKSPPVLTINSPIQGNIYRGNNLAISGKSNEKIISAYVSSDAQEVALTVSPDGFSFTGNMTFSNEGVKNIKISALDRSSNISNVDINFTIQFNKAPLAIFEATGIKSIGQKIEFDASRSSDSDGSIVNYIWNFQDGSIQEQIKTPTVSHIFLNGGVFNVTLTVIDNEGGSSTYINSISINTPPTPLFSFNSNLNTLEISFDASNSSDKDNDQLTFNWSFGDGSSANGKTTSHTYTTPGEYSVTLVVSDQLSSSETTQIVYANISNEEQEEISPGLLALSEQIETRFNSLDQDLIFRADGATLNRVSSENIEVVRNGTQILVQGELVNDQIILHNILENGLNDIEIQTVDSAGRPISGTARVWAGTEKLNIVPEVADNETPAPPYKINVFLANDNQIRSSFELLQASNIPKQKLVVVVEDAINRLGTAIVDPAQLNSSVSVKLFAATPNISPENSDFRGGLSGWYVSGAVPSIITHSESNEQVPGNFDLYASSPETLRVSRVIKSDLQQRSGWVRFKLIGENSNDAFLVLLRGQTSGKIKVEYKNLAAASGSISTNNVIDTGWIESSISDTLVGEAIEMVIVTAPGSVSENLKTKTSNPKTTGAILFSSFIKTANAVTATPTSLVVDGSGGASQCLSNSKFIDYSPSLAYLKQLNGGVNIQEKDILLKGLSVGKFNNAQLGGINTIAARVKLCLDSPIYDWQIETKLNGVPLVLGKANGVTPPLPPLSTDQEYDIAFILDSSALEKVYSSLSTTNGIIELTLYGFKDALHTEKISGKKQTFPIFTKKTWPTKYRYTDDRGDLDGGDDWMTVWMNDLVSEMTEFYDGHPDGNLEFNDASNMNGAKFFPHSFHQQGIEFDVKLRGYNFPGTPWVENQKTMNVFFDLFKEYGKRIDFVYLSHTRPFSNETAQVENIADEENGNFFNPTQISFNRLRHECIDNRLMRRVVTSVKDHKTHFHFRMLKEPNSTTSPGNIDLKVSHGENGILKFQPNIFEWQNDFRYEVYFEKEISTGYKEFVPLKPNINPLGSQYGQIKLKILKIQKLGVDKFSCSTSYETTFPEYVRDEDVEFITVNISPESKCNGEYLKPVRGVLEDEPTSSEVGWVSPDAVINKGNIGANVYLCSNSSLKEYSQIYGGPNGILEVKNSSISAGTSVYGNVRVEYSNIDHADIFGPVSETEWTPETKFTTIRYTDITDLLNEPADIDYNGPNQIYGLVNMMGNSSDRIQIDRSSLPIEAPDSPPGILGTQIISGVQEINISAGSKISNSFISGRNELSMQNKELSISESSEIKSSSIVGNVQILGASKIMLSGVYAHELTSEVPAALGRSIASVDTKISNATILSSTININGEISGLGTLITNSELRDEMVVAEGSIISNSKVYKSALSSSSISSCVNISELQSKNSQIDSSSVSNSIVFDSKVLNSSSVLRSDLRNATEISNSIVYGSTIDSSKVVNGSSASDSIINSNSIVENSNLFGVKITNSNILNTLALSGGVVLDSSIESLKSVVDSQIFNSFISQSLVVDSTVKESRLEESDVRRSTLELSQFKNSAFAEDSITYNSEVNDAQLRPLSNIRDSKVVNKSTVTGSMIRNGSEINYSDVDSSSEIDNSKIIGLTGTYRSGVRNSKIRNYSEIYYSYIADSTVDRSKITSSTVLTSLISNSTLLQVYFSSRNASDSYCYETTNEQGFPIYECRPGGGPEIPGGPTIP